MKLMITVIAAVFSLASLSASAQTIDTVLPKPFADGSSTLLRWTHPAAPADVTVVVSVYKEDGPYAEYTVTRSNAGSGSVTWTPRTYLDKQEYYTIQATWFDGAGQFLARAVQTRVKVYLEGKSRALKIVSPVEGSSFSQGQNLLVQWQSANLPANATIVVALFRSGEQFPCLPVQELVNTGSCILGTSGLGAGDFALSLFYRNEYGVYCQNHYVRFSFY